MPTPTPGPVTGSAARDAVLDELRRAEYHRDDRSWFARARDWLLDRLADLWPHGHGVGFSPLSWLPLLIVVAVVALVVVAAVRAGLPARIRRARPGPDAGDPLAPEPAADHRAHAARFEADGRYAEALREWLRAAVAVVERRGVLDGRPGRTGAAFAREAGPRLPAADAALRAAAAAFDEVYFGGRAASAADALAAHRAADAVETARVAAAGPGVLAVPR